jgi:hypothetical protein
MTKQEFDEMIESVCAKFRVQQECVIMDDDKSEQTRQFERFKRYVYQGEALAGFHGKDAHIAALVRHKEELAGDHGSYLQEQAVKEKDRAQHYGKYVWAEWDADGNCVEPERKDGQSNL